jgi:prolyl-tRNA editing enzyme YbaK/EbsC (Cys-tRNA(Pro) deacylase)
VFGDTLSKAGADFVKSATGYAIGGVPPFGHTQIIKTCLDDALFEFTTVWAAAGDSNSVFEVETEKLLAATLGIQADIKA